ncbi:Muscle-specific protein 20 [Geranomyces michiganensis]|nr:Muscle-specific protein 20 [Geranomyces michiganensis]
MSAPVRGLDKDLAAKAAAKYDPVREAEARAWIEKVTGEQFASDDFHESLKDGVLLCKLVNKLLPDDNAVKFNTSRMPFKQMENINSFLTAIASPQLGVPPHDAFMTVDLYEAKNMNQVVDCLFSISRHAAQKGLVDGTDVLGPKLAERREMSFSDEQLRAGSGVIGLQMGFAGGASQAGMGVGRRQVVDSSVGTGDTSAVSQQMGFTGGANASGVTYGGRREIGGEDPGRASAPSQ